MNERQYEAYKRLKECCDCDGNCTIFKLICDIAKNEVIRGDQNFDQYIYMLENLKNFMILMDIQEN